MKNSFNDLTLDELIQKREEMKKKLNDLRFQNVLGHIDNPMNKRNVRRNIARLNTIIHEYELKIRNS